MKNLCNEIYMDIESGGFKPGELCVLGTGRQYGKSFVADYIRNWQMIFDVDDPFYKVLGTSTVDGAGWYTITCTKEISAWIRETFAELEHKLWFNNIDDKWMINMNTFDMHEELYTMLQLRW